MNVTKITNINQIKNQEILNELHRMMDNEIILIFSDGSFTKIDDMLEGKILDIKSGEPVCLNPINMKWRPVWVGMRLYNADIRTMRRMLMTNDNYIMSYIQTDIIKK